jgi:predicted nucleotidyltransferase component of viral defense system
VYGGTRFSEDLDFVLRPGTTLADLNLPALLESLPSFMRREVPFAERVSVKEQKAESTFARDRRRMELQAPGGSLVINLEFAGVPSRSPRPHILRSDTVDIAIVVKDESEILVDKLVALALRPYVKGRDIWDTWFLTHDHHVAMPQKSAVVAKAADYGTTPVELTSSIGRAKASILASGLSALDAEMKRFLPIRLYDAVATTFADMNANVAALMDILLNQLTGTS